MEWWHGWLWQGVMDDEYKKNGGIWDAAVLALIHYTTLSWLSKQQTANRNTEPVTDAVNDAVNVAGNGTGSTWTYKQNV